MNDETVQRMPQRDRRAPRGRVLDAHLHLLDRQVLDRDGTPVTTVDDLELDGIELGARIEPGSPAPTGSSFTRVTFVHAATSSPPASTRDKSQ